MSESLRIFIWLRGIGGGMIFQNAFHKLFNFIKNQIIDHRHDRSAYFGCDLLAILNNRSNVSILIDQHSLDRYSPET